MRALRPRALTLLLPVLCAALVAACGDDATSPHPGAGGENAGGSGDGGSSDAGLGGGELGAPLTLVEHTPETDAENVWFYAPIQLVFSDVLDPAAAFEEAITVTVGGEPLGWSLALSDDGTSLSLMLEGTPPVLPATATVTVTDALHSASGGVFVEESFSYQLPLWHTTDEVDVDGAVSAPALGLDASDVPFVAANVAGEVTVQTLGAAGWEAVGGSLNTGGEALGAPSLTVGADGRPRVAFAEAARVSVMAWDGASWTQVGEPLTSESTSPEPQLVRDEAGELLLGYRLGDERIDVRRFRDEVWEDAGTLTGGAALGGFALAVDGTTPVLAYYDESADVALAAASGSTGFAALAPPIDRLDAESNGRPSLVIAAGATYVAFVDADDSSQSVFVSRYTDDPLAPPEPVRGALDLVLDAEAFAPVLAASAEGNVNLAWRETYAGVTKTLAARLLSDDQLEFLGPALASRAVPGAGAGADTGELTLVVDSHGYPTLLLAGTDAALKRYNGSPEAPFGLAERSSTAACTIPADDSSGFPTTLAATGCYANVAEHRLLAGALPFELNSPLWSDGATKRRFLVLPDDETATLTAAGAWELPVGTIAIKEFWYEKTFGDPTTSFPMETRFLVKRCEEGDCPEPLQGYSFQWNEAGTEATLLSDEDCAGTTQGCKVVSWPVNETETGLTTHDHVYPGRTDCVRCHNTGAGRFLGIQTPQLNRAHEFANAIDNQIRTFASIGALASAPSAPAALTRLPQPRDPSLPLEQRVRAYFHSNCSHCHNPASEQPAPDFRYQGAGITATNICDKLVKGSPSQSPLYLKDATRAPTPVPAPGVGAQMPPIATLLPDARQLPLTFAWIESGTSCP